MVNLFFKLAVLLVTFSFLECSTQKSDTQLNQAFGQDSASTKIKINSLEDTSELSLKADLLYANDQYDEGIRIIYETINN